MSDTKLPTDVSILNLNATDFNIDNENELNETPEEYSNEEFDFEDDADIDVITDETSKSSEVRNTENQKESREKALLRKYNEVVLMALDILGEEKVKFRSVSSLPEIPKDFEKINALILGVISGASNLLTKEEIMEIKSLKTENIAESLSDDTKYQWKSTNDTKTTTLSSVTENINEVEFTENQFPYALCYDRIIFILEREEPYEGYSYLVLAGDSLPNPIDVMVTLVHEVNTHYINDALEEVVAEFYYVHIPKKYKQNLMYVGIPHIYSKQKLPKTKERVLNIRAKDIKTNDWKTYFASHDVKLDMPDGHGYRICFSRIDSNNFMATVISRPNVQKLYFSPTQTFSFKSNIDPRITLEINCNKHSNPIWLNLQVIQLDSLFISDLKQRCEDETINLLKQIESISPLLNLDWQLEKTERFSQAIKVTIPLVLNNSLYNRSKHIPKSILAFSEHQNGGLKNDENEDKLHYIGFINGNWAVLKDINRQSKISKQDKYDLLSFELKEMYTRLLIFKTSSKMNCEQVVKVVECIWSYLTVTSINIIVRRRESDPFDIVTSVVPLNATNKINEMLDEKGYTEKIELSKNNKEKPFLIEDGTIIQINLKGNIKNSKDEVIKWMYGSNLNTIIELKVEILNIFMQKAFSSYKGSLSFESIRLAKLMKPGQKNNATNIVELIENKTFLQDALLTFPKIPLKALIMPVVKNRPPIDCIDDKIDDELLMMIARNLGNEWIKLYQHLGMSKLYVNLLTRGNKDLESNTDNFEDKYDVLRTWVFNQLKFSPKLPKLIDALTKIGRTDIVQEIERLPKKSTLDLGTKLPFQQPQAPVFIQKSLEDIEKIENVDQADSNRKLTKKNNKKNLFLTVNYAKKYMKEPQRHAKSVLARFKNDDIVSTEIIYEDFPEKLKNNMRVYSNKIIESVIIKKPVAYNSLQYAVTKSNESLNKTTDSINDDVIEICL